MTTAVLVAPICIGPTWQRDSTGKFVLPEKTLGWQQLGWTRDYLLHPDGPQAREPLQLTDEQARFLLWWSAVDAKGVFLYRYGMLRRLKGWGKDPQGSFLIALEFVGPCRFGGWDRNGDPIAVSHPAAWVQTAAVSKEQTRNTMTLFPGLFSPRAIEEYGIDIGKEIIYADRGRRRIEAVTSSPRALEGGRATFILKNETHHWIASNEGDEMSKVIARNVAKGRDGASRVLAISNAHAPGENSDAEHDWDAHRAGPPVGMLYDSVEAPETDLKDPESVRAGIVAARGDSVWLDPDRLTAEILDPRTTRAMARRFYLNQIDAEEDRPFDKARFLELERKGYTVPDKAAITLGFDGSISRDHTALIGTEVETGYQWVAGYWEPVLQANGEMEIPFAEVDQTVDEVFRRWAVWRMYVDPSHWRDYMAKWEGRHGTERIVHWATTAYRKMATSLVAYRDAMQLGELSHDGDPRFVAAIGNAYKHMMQFRDDDGEPMWIIQKERPDSPLKIDAAMAGDLSWAARTDAVAAGVKNRTAAVNPDYNRSDERGPELAGVREKRF